MTYLARVAIIMRTRNREVLLERAINSVLNQTYDDWYLVIVNDGGDRAPVERLLEMYRDRIGNRVAVIHNDCSRGMEAATNLGLAYGESEYVVIHDDDDSWAPNFLRMSLNELERASATLPSVQGVMCYSLRVWERVNGRSVQVDEIEPFNNWVPKGVLSLFRMAEGNFFPPISFIYNRKVLDMIGTYREDLPVLGDWEFNLRFMSRYDIFVAPYALAFYHHRREASGALGNSILDGVRTHDLYAQYLRNDLLRSDISGQWSGLGLVLNIAQSQTSIIDRVNGIQCLLDSQLLDPITRPELAAQTSSWRPLWFLASVSAFIRSGTRVTLARKFIDHWRQEGPRRAFSVLVRYGYLAMGGR